MPCKQCGTPLGPPVDAEEEREDGFVIWFREKYKCEVCGAIGWLEVDQGGDYINEEHTGTVFRA